MIAFVTMVTVHIRAVWDDNLEEEFKLISNIVDDYPYIAMDTEFPGDIVRPLGDMSRSLFNFHSKRVNVNTMKLIQLGLTFSDGNGMLPTCGTGKYCIWQFNFREFNRDEDIYILDSIELLTNSGIDFKKNNEEGVDAIRFGQLLMSSGVVLNDDVIWITFHGGHDFGYLLKILTGKNLPDTPARFFDLIRIFFPAIYDVKYLMKFCHGFYGWLSGLAERLGAERFGSPHQAGSDSLLACSTFFELIRDYFIDSDRIYGRYDGAINGLEPLL